MHLQRSQRTFSQKLIWIKTAFFEKPKVKVHCDDLWPKLYGIYLIIIPNEREFYKLQVDQKVNCAQSYGRLSAKGLAEFG